MSSEVVTVAHPAIFGHVPRGCRNERLSHVRLETPVRLVHVGAREIRHVASVDSNHHHLGVHAYGGRLWIPAESASGDASPGAPGGLVEYLRDRSPPHEVSRVINASFLRTPVTAAGAGGATRGASPGELGAVTSDGSDEARARLARFVEDDILLAGDRAYIRCPGPLVPAEPGRRPWEEVDVLARGAFRMRPLFRLDRIAEADAFHARTAWPGWGATEPEARPACERLLRSIPADHIRDDDVACFLNRAASAALLVGDRQSSYLSRLGGEVREGLAAVRAPLAGLELRGSLGMVSADETETLIEALSAYVEFVGARRDVAQEARLREIVDYAETVALPRWRAESPLVPDDADALSALSPVR